MCDPVSAIAGAATAAAGAAAANHKNKEEQEAKEKQQQKEEAKKTEDKDRLEVLQPRPKQAEVRIGNTRSLRNLASNRNPLTSTGSVKTGANVGSSVTNKARNREALNTRLLGNQNNNNDEQNRINSGIGALTIGRR